MNKGLSRLLKWGGYPLFAIVVFLVMFVLMFPYDRLKDRLEEHIAAASPQVKVRIGELGPSFLLGLSAQKVELRFAPTANPAPPQTTAPASGDKDAKPKRKQPRGQRLVIDEISIKPGLFALLGGNLDISFDIDGLAGGSLEGRYKLHRKKKTWSLELEMEKVKLAGLPMVASAVPIPLGGAISASVELSVPEGKIKSAEGTVELSCEGCTVGDGKKKLKVPGNPLLASGITVPRVRVGKLGGEIQVDKGVATLKNFSSKSPDIELALSGGVTMQQPLAFSTVSAYLKFKISKALKEKDAKFELVESGLGNAKRPDGFFGIKLMGPLKQLKPIPSRSEPGKPGSGPGRMMRGRFPG